MDAPLPLIPRPVSHQGLPGAFELAADLAILAAPEVRDSAYVLADALVGAGVRARVDLQKESGTTPGAIHLRLDPAALHGLTAPDGEATGTTTTAVGPDANKANTLNPEAYRLEITPDGATITGATPAGVARAVQTFRQLLPARALRRAPVVVSPVSLPACLIEDAPRFAWRGVHLDVARHFMPVGFVLKLIDLAALHRLDTVHLHLTDDQGWRFEFPAYPRLTEVGAWRRETVIGFHNETNFDGTPHGGFYTRDDLAEIVAYARARHITLVPEVDLPGHVQAVLAAYPELGNTGEPLEVRRNWDISEHVLAPTTQALEFAKAALDVVLDTFPGPWVHLGGDECPRTQWRASAAAATRAAELGLGSVDELQSWFLGELAAHVRAAGRRVVGWDEVIEDGGMPSDTLIMAWRGAGEHGLAALRAGHDVVMCPSSVTYFDHYQDDGAAEPLAIGGLTRVQDVAGWEPERGDGPGRVIGVQGQLWTEYMPTGAAVEYMAFPRLCALAEVAWSAPGASLGDNEPDTGVAGGGTAGAGARPAARDVDELLSRLPGHLERLAALGVNYRPLTGPVPGQQGGTGRRQRQAGKVQQGLDADGASLQESAAL